MRVHAIVCKFRLRIVAKEGERSVRCTFCFSSIIFNAIFSGRILYVFRLLGRTFLGEEFQSIPVGARLGLLDEVAIINAKRDFRLASNQRTGYFLLREQMIWKSAPRDAEDKFRMWFLNIENRTSKFRSERKIYCAMSNFGEPLIRQIFRERV